MNSKKENLDIIFKKIIKVVDPAIKKIIASSVVKEHQEIIEYQVSCGGKRIRPILAILSCNLLGGKLKDVLYPAACLEILHNYTLIVDDIIDHSELRRSNPTVWKKYGLGTAECISMSYAASIFDLPTNLKNKEQICRVLATTLKEITDGQIFDILFEQGGREDEDYVVKNRYSKVSAKDYFAMISEKTASLLRACCEIGGICAQATDKEINILKNFGYNLGLAFQIQDDLLDIFGQEKKLGKKIGKDIVERKLGNIVILLALKEFSPDEKERFLKILRKKKISDKDIKTGIGLIKKTQAQSKASQLEAQSINKVKDSLSNLPQNKWNDSLQEFAEFLTNRQL